MDRNCGVRKRGAVDYCCEYTQDCGIFPEFEHEDLLLQRLRLQRAKVEGIFADLERKNWELGRREEENERMRHQVAQLNEMKEELERKEKVCKELGLEYAQLRGECGELRSVLEGEEKSDFQGKYEATLKDIRKVQLQVGLLKEARRHGEDSLSDADKRSEDKRVQFEEELRTLMLKRDECLSLLNEEKARNNQLEERCRKSKASSGSKNGDIARIKAECERLQAEFAKLQKELARRVGDGKCMRSEIRDLKLLAHKGESEFCTKMQQLDQKRADLEKEHDQLKATLAQIEKERQELELRLEASGNNFESEHLEVRKLRVELESAQGEQRAKMEQLREVTASLARENVEIGRMKNCQQQEQERQDGLSKLRESLRNQKEQQLRQIEDTLKEIGSKLKA